MRARSFAVISLVAAVVGTCFGEDSLMDMSLEELLNVRISDVSVFSPNLEREGVDLQRTPGVLTVITRDEIRRRGYRTLSDVLLSVPGFSMLQNDDEYLVPPRGVYSTTNQKLLLMRDGHVYNEPVIDLARLDYAISLNSIERIEIIRGPGASLYGNSAMGAVVNIVTFKGDRKEVTIKAGDYGQVDYDTVLAAENDDYSLTMYGRYARVAGQHRYMSAAQDPSVNYKKDGEHYAWNFPDNANMGMLLSRGNLTTALAYQRDVYYIYWGLQGQNTDADELIHQPMFAMDSVHADVDYDFEITDNLSLRLNHFGDHVDLHIVKNSGEITPDEPRGQTMTKKWEAWKAGVNYVLYYNPCADLNMLAGVYVDYRVYGDNPNDYKTATGVTAGTPFEKGDEVRYAEFVQIEKEFGDHLVVNGGYRYDSCDEYGSSGNPRLAVVVAPTRNVSAKLIYGTAFQYPGWSYQKSTSYESGSLEDLDPERLTSYQAVLRYDSDERRFFAQAVYFLNELDDIIVRYQGYRQNSGTLTTHGTEFETAATIGRLRMGMSYALLLPKGSEFDPVLADARLDQHGNLEHIPEHTVNVDLTYRMSSLFSANLSGKWESGFRDMNENKQDSKVLMNATLIAKTFMENVDLSLSVHNLLDEDYLLGDDGMAPVPQMGRSFQVGATALF